MSINADKCGTNSGTLPGCAPLSAAYIPMQQTEPPRYESGKALSRGTLFPGLDLPFKNTANKSLHTDSPLGELMAMSFVLDELGLYLDTHTDDKEAFAVYKDCAAMYKAGYKKYIETYGPLTQQDTAVLGRYNWLEAPWPWENAESR